MVKAESLQALQAVEKNYSFSSCADDLRRFKQMLPYLDTAKG